MIWGGDISNTDCCDLMKKVNILGVQIDAVRLEQLLEIIRQTNLRNERTLIMHANLMAVNIAYKNKAFKEILNNADIVFL